MPETVSVLVVDDRAENLAVMEAILGEQKIDLVKAASGNDALRFTLKRDFALVLLDVQMPGMDGFETAELIRANPKTRHLPIIFVTAGMHDTKLLFKGYELGAVDYLIKPFEPHVLRSKVNVFCELYRQRYQLESNQRLLESKIRERVAELRESEERLLAAKAEAERANNAKSRFLAAASHDLRQPLSALNLYIDVLQRKVAPPQLPLVNNMKDCAASLSELLTDLLDLSKLDAGVLTPKVSDFPIAEIMSNLVSVHAPEARLKGLRLRCVPSRLAGRTDPVLFQRMLGNLLSNALRYTERGSVLVGCRRRHGKTWVEVWDTGAGIPKEKTGEIFEEFKQLGDMARNRGSGLGLAIVAKSSALLGLQIRVESQVGRGSMFALELPVGKRVKKAANRKLHHRSLRIALVEDNADVRQALVHALSGVGHELVAAMTGRELHARLEGFPPDLVISDYRLAEEETGFDVITSIRDAFGESLPAVLITGDTDPKLLRSMATRGIVVQHKPLEIEALQVCIAALMQSDATTAP
jgi:two-component system, sensor histidine kinase